MSVEIELDEPYRIMYENLVEKHGEDEVESDIKEMVQNALHETTQHEGNQME